MRVLTVAPEAPEKGEKASGRNRSGGLSLRFLFFSSAAEGLRLMSRWAEPALEAPAPPDLDKCSPVAAGAVFLLPVSFL